MSKTLINGFDSSKSEMTGIKLEKRESVSKNCPNETKQDGRRSTKNATASPSHPTLVAGIVDRLVALERSIGDQFIRVEQRCSHRQGVDCWYTPKGRGTEELD